MKNSTIVNENTEQNDDIKKVEKLKNIFLLEVYLKNLCFKGLNKYKEKERQNIFDGLNIGLKKSISAKKKKKYKNIKK